MLSVFRRKGAAGFLTALLALPMGTPLACEVPSGAAIDQLDGDRMTGFETARNIYLKALEARPTDKEVRTDIGISYFLQQPPDYASAIKNFKQNLESDPKHERTLQFLVQALAKSGQNNEAAKYYATLRTVDPSNPILREFSTLAGPAGDNK